jgi:ribose-phosphate pyrophosphokinase
VYASTQVFLKMFRNVQRYSYLPVLTGLCCSHTLSRKAYASEEYDNVNTSKILDNVVILPGSATKDLTKKVCDKLGMKVGLCKTYRFSDGEILPIIEESMRGKHIFIMQTCAPPVNENLIEIILTVTAARRAGAATVTTVIPYFGYKYHLRGLPLSSTYHSRFLWNAAADFAKMLVTVGTDRIISIDLQRPGQGHEACFFSSDIVVESINANNELVDYFVENQILQEPVVVVAPNAGCVKKAQNFRTHFKAKSGMKNVEYATFVYESPPVTNNLTTEYLSISKSELLGNVNGADVVIVDNLVDTAGSLSILTRRLVKEGARKVYICANHGLFTDNSMELIDLSPVELVVVTDTLPLPEKSSKKVVQVSTADLLAKVIKTQYNALILEKDIEANSDDLYDYEYE